MSHNPLTDEELENLLSELELCGIYGRQVRALAELQERRAADKNYFMFGIADPSGQAHMDEFCVSSDKGLLEIEVDALNQNEGTDGYRVVGLYTVLPLTNDERTELQELRKSVNAGGHFQRGYDEGHSRGLTCGKLYKTDDQMRQHRAACVAGYKAELRGEESDE